jgi:hypothetical protein
MYVGRGVEVGAPPFRTIARSGLRAHCDMSIVLGPRVLGRAGEVVQVDGVRLH